VSSSLSSICDLLSCRCDSKPRGVHIVLGTFYFDKGQYFFPEAGVTSLCPPTVCENGSFEPLMHKCDLCTKTGSGQTYRENSKNTTRTIFSGAHEPTLDCVHPANDQRKQVCCLSPARRGRSAPLRRRGCADLAKRRRPWLPLARRRGATEGRRAGSQRKLARPSLRVELG
jgi:hypothetical protein